MPEDRVNQRGEIEEAKGLRGSSAAGAEREYIKLRETRPRRNARRRAAISPDPLEQRAAQDQSGSVLERIVFKRLTTIWGPPGIGFIYKYQLGTGGAKNARAFIGGREMDFVILNRPSGKEMDLEILGSHWHGPSVQFADLERALDILRTGRDYAEIWEWEILIGDDYLDNRLLQLIGAQGRVSPGVEYRDEIEAFNREVLVRET